MAFSKSYGAALIAGSLGTIVTMLFHPTGGDVMASGHGARVDVLTHSLAICSYSLLLFGLVGLCRFLGAERPAATAALVSYGLGVFAVVCAAVFSGLLAPELATVLREAEGEDRGTVIGLWHYNGMLNQAFAKVFVVASSVGVALWSLCLLGQRRLARAAGIVGCVAAAATLVAFFMGMHLDIHGFGLIALLQAAWAITVGVRLLCDVRAPDGEGHTALTGG